MPLSPRFRAREARQRRKQAEIDPVGADIRPAADTARENDMRHALSFEKTAQGASLFQRHPLVVETVETGMRIRLAVDQDDKGGVAMRPQAFGDIDREAATAGNDRDAVGRCEIYTGCRPRRRHRRRDRGLCRAAARRNGACRDW